MFTITFPALANLLECPDLGQGLATGASIDSRTTKPGDLFFAIKGERFDGHEFIANAVEKGAVAAVVTYAVDVDIPQFVVSDTTLALGKIAADHRAKFNIPIIGVTGSCGKTTTKTMIASILNGVKPTLSTQGTKNNYWGVPLTLLELTKEHHYAVIEMGADKAGEIAYLASLVKPTIAVITNAAPSHLQGFGGIHGVATAKGELFLSLSPESTALVNDDDTYAALWMSYLKHHKTYRFGHKPTADIYATDIHLNSNLTSRFQLHLPEQKPLEVHLGVLGEHNVDNALAASAVTYALGVNAAMIKQGLETMKAVYSRLVTHQGLQGAYIIDDCYNANPTSVRAALRILAGRNGEKIFVFADMNELGEDTLRLHQEIGEFAREHGIDRLFATGKLAEATVTSFGPNATFFANKGELIQALLPLLHDNVSVLVKASRSLQFEHVVAALLIQ